jgi:hypothetical protein
MVSAERAQSVARELLESALPRRWAHTEGVARRAREAAPVAPAYAEVLEAAAWLHDIGYSPTLAATGFHPLDGARHLREATDAAPALCCLVAHHSGAVVEGRLRDLSGVLEREFPLGTIAPPALLDVLTYCDMTTGPAGDPVTVDERLAEIGERYPADSVVHRAIAELAPTIRGQCADVAAALSDGRSIA